MRTTLVLCAFTSLLLAACKPKAGSGCDVGASTCSNETTALSCVNGIYQAFACKGPGGCVESNGVVMSCDIGGNAAGEACFEQTRNPLYCSADKKGGARCGSGKVVLETCDAKGCTVSDGKAACTPAAKQYREGDACTNLLGLASDVCRADGKAWLTCASGKYVITEMCRGPLGCKPFEGGVACDSTQGEIGDPCSGRSRCDKTATKVLACEEGKLKVARECPGPKGCTTDAEFDPKCDDGTGKKK